MKKIPLQLVIVSNYYFSHTFLWKWNFIAIFEKFNPYFFQSIFIFSYISASQQSEFFFIFPCRLFLY